MQTGKTVCCLQHVEQNFNNDQNEFLWTLLAEPANDGYACTPDLQRLVNDFPQSGILHALLAHSGNQSDLKRAAIHFNPQALFKLINAPTGLSEVSGERIILHGRSGAIDIPENEDIAGTEVLTANEPEKLNEPEDDAGPDADSNSVVSQEQTAENLNSEPVHHNEAIEEETYEEIVGIEDINTQSAPVFPVSTEEDKLIADNIVSTDFFMFDKAFGEQEAIEEEKEAGRDATTTEPIQHDISKYNDDKMPYTFMWWLDKTRREHAATLQPYVKAPVADPGIATNASSELQQQYIENIFHITPLEDLNKGSIAPVVAEPKRKEQEIIERFIQEEPQIKPQSSDKLDNENKARKSAEDQEELVTETLAAIYTDQMLYHKAIASYKKLMLKFPEKSRYFADKIEQLEKRTN